MPIPWACRFLPNGPFAANEHHGTQMSKDKTDSMEKGVQPLDQILMQCGLQNSDLVEKSPDQLTHKMVAKGRKGRQLTLNAQLKILRALNACGLEKTYKLSELFNYGTH